MRGAIHPLPHTFSWRGTLLRAGTTFTFYLYILLSTFYDYVDIKPVPQWLHVLKWIPSSTTRTLVSWDRMPIEVWMNVRVFPCFAVLCR
jgi:hypothetical protein